jgi:hypothetical protein
MTLSVSRLTSDVRAADELERVSKEMVVVALSRYYPGLCQSGRCPGQDTNLVLPEYQSTALPLNHLLVSNAIDILCVPLLFKPYSDPGISFEITFRLRFRL